MSSITKTPNVSATELHLLALSTDYLQSTGWLRSVEAASALDASGPVPWFTYPAIRYLQRLTQPHWHVLEFGSGNSSRWWSQRVAKVVSVEHDPVFAQSLLDRALPNVTVVERTMDDPVPPELHRIFREDYFPHALFGLASPDPTRNYRAGLLDAAYLAYAAVGLEHPAGYFDVIVVDGMARVLTAWVAARQLATDGIVVFDNADRDDYADGYALLQRAGFSRIDFWGMGPINAYEWCTSIFVRSLTPLLK